MAGVAALVVFFVYGFLVEGMLIRKDFALSAALYRTSDLQMKYMPLRMSSVLVGSLAAAALYAKWCGGASGAMTGLQFGLADGRVHVVRACALQPCDYEHESETRAGNHREHVRRMAASRHHDWSGL
jgi:hypothetical protein